MSKLSYTPTFHMYDEFPELVWVSIGGESVAYFREKMCRNVDDAAECGYFKCSECNTECSVDWCYSGYGIPNYCPNCGAQVEEEQ